MDKRLHQAQAAVIYDQLKKGITHNFIVKSTDAAGNMDEDQFTWTVTILLQKQRR
jgi:hypothetical protein